MGALAGQVALITGGGRGIGAETAKQLAQLGATVALVARTREQLEATAQQIRAAGGRAYWFVADVSDEGAMREAVHGTLAITGNIDILVNNAGFIQAVGPIENSDPAEWWRTVEGNLKGLYLTTRLVLPTMLEQGHGQIVNVLSIAGARAFSGLSAYSCAKAAGLMFTRILAKEVRKRGIRVMAILPGAVDTAIWGTGEGVPDREKMIRPSSVAQLIAQMLTTPPDATVDELWVLPREGVL
ncbi:MAG: SDR family oxidoreductase [Fimbriimonadales bacterium]|nr:SDR family oxidoreductase [Fimbriimonadales bacterium]MDW8051686.1 SDR family NAD(P)-dependent oxidoreductase [Armatimonadota bacterium]